jgi:hypothetical protein
MATVATLLFVPVVFTLVHRGRDPKEKTTDLMAETSADPLSP